VPQKADYDATVRQAVLDRLLHDRLNVEQTKAAMQRGFGAGGYQAGLTGAPSEDRSWPRTNRLRERSSARPYSPRGRKWWQQGRSVER
jgi:hypothetical protein